jgi:hypothetical protein
MEGDLCFAIYAVIIGVLVLIHIEEVDAPTYGISLLVSPRPLI